MTDDCLFNQYNIGGLNGDGKYYGFNQLCRKCGCEECIEMLESLKRASKK